MNIIKNDILTVAEFQENRPDMSSFSSNEIQSAIFQVSTFLDAKCNGLISDVWYVVEPTNPLFRTDNEKNYIKEAFIQQCQYNLNLGNDWSVGSNSMSTGGLSGSFQRPIDRDEFAPGVQVLLQKARVYETFYGLSFGKQVSVSPDQSINDYLTYSAGDTRYVSKFQASGNEGQVAVLNNAKVVTFQEPSGIAWNTTGTLKIWDKYSSMYVDIHDVNSLCFYGINDYGFASGMSRGEIRNAIAIKNSLWKEDVTYSLGVLVSFGYENALGKQVLGQFESLQPNNIGHNPSLSPAWWKFWESGTIDMNEIVIESVKQVNAIFTPLFEEYKLQTLDTINTSFTDLSTKLELQIQTLDTSLNNKYQHLGMQLSNNVQAAIDTIPVEIDTQLNALPTIDIDFYPKGKVLSFITKVLGVEFITSKGWVEGVDYEVLTIGQYLRIGENGNTVGDLNLPQSALPNIIDTISIGTASRVHVTCNVGASNKMLKLKNRDSGRVGAIPDQGAATTQDNFTFELNGNVTQTRNQPIAQQVWAIQMLKTRSEKGVIRSLPTIGWNDIIGPWTDRVELVNEFAKYTTLVNFNTLQTEVNTIRTDLGDMGDIVNENTNKITLNTTNITTNATDLTAIKANYLTTNTVQEITARKSIAVNNEFLDYKVSGTDNWGGFRVLQNNVEAFLFGKAGGGSEGIIKAPLGNILIQPKDAVVVNNKPIKGVSNPTNGTDAANKQYVDSNNHSWTKKAYAQEVKWFNSSASRDAFKTANGLTSSQCVDMNVAVGSLNFPAVRFLVDIA